MIAKRLKGEDQEKWVRTYRPALIFLGVFAAGLLLYGELLVRVASH